MLLSAVPRGLKDLEVFQLPQGLDIRYGIFLADASALNDITIQASKAILLYLMFQVVWMLRVTQLNLLMIYLNWKG
jgi:hypothetical protein